MIALSNLLRADGTLRFLKMLQKQVYPERTAVQKALAVPLFLPVSLEQKGIAARQRALRLVDVSSKAALMLDKYLPHSH